MLSVRPDKARKNFQEAGNFLANDLKSVAAIMRQYYPLAILSKAAWHRYEVENSHRTDEMALSSARITPVLLQSVYQSRYYSAQGGVSAQQEVRQKDWDRITNLVDDASRRLVRMMESTAVIAVSEGKISEGDLPEYLDALYHQLFGYTVERGQIDGQKILFESIFTEDEALVEKTFNTDSRNLVSQLESLSQVFAFGIADTVEQTKALNAQIRAEVDNLRQEKPALTQQLASDEVIAKGGYRNRLMELNQKASGYDLFAVEMNSLLSTQQCLLFSCDASCLDDVICDGFFSAVLHPFIRFADRFYCFTGSFFYNTIAHALRKILRSTGYVEGYTSKLEKLFNHFVLNLFHQSDVEDVYTFRGFKADIILLPSMRYVNAYKYPSVFSSRLMQRMDEMKRKPQPGHVMLVVDPDSSSPLEKKVADVFHISLECLASVSLSGDTEGFMKKLFETDDISVDDVEPAVFDEVLFEDELDRSPSADTPVPLDDLPQEVLLDDDLEYDRTDDDDKARLIEARFDEEEHTPQDDGYTPPRLSPETIEQYDLPESLKNEDVEEELEDLDSDDFIDDEEEAVDDESADDFLFEEIDEDEMEEEPDDGFDDEFDDPDQLLLFDDDFEPVEYSQDMKKASLEPEAAEEEKPQEPENPADEGKEPENSENPEDRPADEPVNAQQEIASEPEAEESLPDDDDIIPEDSSLAGAGKSELHSGPEEEVLQEEDLLADEDFSEEDAGDEPACADEITEASEEEAGESEPGSVREEESLPDEENLLSEPEVEESLPDDDDIIPEDSSIADAEESELHSEPEEEVQEALQEEDLLADEDFSEEDAVDEPACTDEITEASEEEEADEDDDADSAETEPAQESSEDEPIETPSDEEDKTPSAGDVIEEKRPDYSSETEYTQYDGRTLPPSIGKIVSSLDQKIDRFDDFLAGIDDMTLTTFEEVVKRSISAALSEQKDKMLVISPYELSFIFTGNSRIDDLRKMEIRNNAGAQMYARGRKNWAVILLVYDGMENLDFVWSESLTRASFSASDWKIVQVIGEELKKGLHK